LWQEAVAEVEAVAAATFARFDSVNEDMMKRSQEEAAAMAQDLQDKVRSSRREQEEDKEEEEDQQQQQRGRYLTLRYDAHKILPFHTHNHTPPFLGLCVGGLFSFLPPLILLSS
jgi:hypothetical protein